VGSEPLGKSSTLSDSSTAYQHVDSHRHDPIRCVLNMELLQFYYSAKIHSCVVFRNHYPKETMRDDFSEEVKRTLVARVGNRCSNPHCRALTSGPQDDPTKALNVGIGAHITAASPGGPRYNASLTPEERCHPDNGIWLCQTCAKLVDNDTSQFPVHLLHAWKTIAEHEARYAIGKTAATAPVAGESNRNTQSEGHVEEVRTAEQKKRLLNSIDLTARLEHAYGQHIELKVENKSDVIVQVTQVLVLCNGVKAAEYRIETNAPGRIAKRSQKLISWTETPGLAQAIQEIRGEFNREFYDFVEIQLQVEALDQLKVLPSQKIKVKVEPGGRRVWQIR